MAGNWLRLLLDTYSASARKTGPDDRPGLVFLHGQMFYIYSPPKL